MHGYDLCRKVHITNRFSQVAAQLRKLSRYPLCRIVKTNKPTNMSSILTFSIVVMWAAIAIYIWFRNTKQNMEAIGKIGIVTEDFQVVKRHSTKASPVIFTDNGSDLVGQVNVNNRIWTSYSDPKTDIEKLRKDSNVKIVNSGNWDGDDYLIVEPC